MPETDATEARETTREAIMVTVEVTQEDIANGQRGKCMACPIALAVTRATGAKLVSVSADESTGVFPDGIRRYADTPLGASEFMRRFDHGLSVKPFTLALTFVPIPTP